MVYNGVHGHLNNCFWRLFTPLRLSDMDGLLLGTVTEKVRPCGPLLSAQGAQRQTAGAECQHNTTKGFE